MNITHFNIFNFQGALEEKGDESDSLFGFFNSRKDYDMVEEYIDEMVKTWQYAKKDYDFDYSKWFRKNGIIKHSYGIEELILLGPNDLQYLIDHPESLNLIIVSIVSDDPKEEHHSYIMSYGQIKKSVQERISEGNTESSFIKFAHLLPYHEELLFNT